MNDEKFAVLWSPHQNSFQVETVGDMLETNLRIFLNQQAGDFVVLAFADDHEEAKSLCKSFQKVRDSRVDSA
jgi:hypothetical protein